MLIEDELAKAKAERDAFKVEVGALERKLARAQTELAQLVNDWTDARVTIAFLTKQVDEVNTILETVRAANESLRN